MIAPDLSHGNGERLTQIDLRRAAFHRLHLLNRLLVATALALSDHCIDVYLRLFPQSNIAVLDMHVPSFLAGVVALSHRDQQAAQWLIQRLQNPLQFGQVFRRGADKELVPGTDDRAPGSNQGFESGQHLLGQAMMQR